MGRDTTDQGSLLRGPVVFLGKPATLDREVSKSAYNVLIPTDGVGL
jgi:hypothetical protein